MIECSSSIYSIIASLYTLYTPYSLYSLVTGFFQLDCLLYTTPPTIPHVVIHPIFSPFIGSSAINSYLNRSISDTLDSLTLSLSSSVNFNQSIHSFLLFQIHLLLRLDPANHPPLSLLQCRRLLPVSPNPPWATDPSLPRFVSLRASRAETFSKTSSSPELVLH